jgi:hypothetical protein
MIHGTVYGHKILRQSVKEVLIPDPEMNFSIAQWSASLTRADLEFPPPIRMTEYVFDTPVGVYTLYGCGKCNIQPPYVGACDHIHSLCGGQGYKFEPAPEDLPPLPLEHQYVGALRQFRIWRYNEKAELIALVRGDHIWTPGENRALNMSETMSGFHGFKSLSELYAQETPNSKHHVVGTILCYGRIKVGTKGARAQYAIPEYLVKTGAFAANPGTVMGIARKYSMKIISEEMAYDLKTGLVPYRKPKEK